ncbi:DUF6089 family protein [Limibacterium fermenti]|uniref:type IX secretion system protein PorG n=1 Tax=Limibacterium fermenti TaxID=3229863 RepID=UPI003A5F802B
MNKQFIAILLVSAYSNIAFAQEYKYEIGGGTGASFYMGDANKSAPFLYPGWTGSAIYRYTINFHWAVKANASIGRLWGNTDQSGNRFPFEKGTSFSRNFGELGGQMEFNFFPYSDKYSYLGTKPYTPYVLVGGSVTMTTIENSPSLSVAIPLGIGFKYKLKNRWNVGGEFSVKKSLGDKLDVTQKNAGWDLNGPYGIKSSFLKNQDWYLQAIFYLTWEFGLRSDPCHGM